MILGHIQTDRAGKTAGYEYLRIESHNGVLAYISTIKGRETVFTAVKVTAEEAVFENLAHDFPQRIIYRATPDGLSARVESADRKRDELSVQAYCLPRIAIPLDDGEA